MIKIILHAQAIELALPRTIKPRVRRAIYKPINQLKEQTPTRVAQLSYKTTSFACISKYEYLFKESKQELLDTIENALVLNGLPYEIIEKGGNKVETLKTKEFCPISGEAYVRYSQGSANRITTITITLKNAPISLGLKSKIANEYLTESWGLLSESPWPKKDKLLKKVIRLTTPLSNSWEVLEKLAEETIEGIKNEIKVANIEYNEKVDPIPKAKTYTL